MRITNTIERPLQDEHVLAVDPPLRPEVSGVWRRRLNPFTGRAVSDRALTAEQEARNGIQRLRGQSVTAGIISGLDVMFEPGARIAAAGAALLQILPGLALCRNGEDVVIASPRRLALGNLPVYARVDQLDAIAAGAPAGGTDPEAPAPGGDVAPASPGVRGSLRPPLPRRIGPEFASLLGAPAAADLPRVAVLVAEPVNATILAGPGDHCSRDPRDDPYDDLQRIDGCRLVLAFWPAEMRAVTGGPDYSLPPPGPGRRNRLAYRVFGIERLMLSEELHPWEELGVPMALIGFNADWTLDFVDRAAVVRLGGQPTQRTPPVPFGGSPLLAQARVNQFVEHLADLPDLAPATLAGAFRQLPPIGFLPAEVVNLATRRQQFFPPGFTLSAAPVPLEQLDVLMHDSAALLPISLDVPDCVELLVPVPEWVYEPGLLEVATVDPAFARAMNRYIADRSDWIIRRELVRRRRDLLLDALTGQRESWPAADLPTDEVLPYPTTRAPLTATRVIRVDAGTAPRALSLLKAGSTLAVNPRDRLYVWLRIASTGGFTGFSLRFNHDPQALETDIFSAGVFWGSADQLPIAAVGDTNIALRRQGDLPEAGRWLRLEIPADARWTLAGDTLAGKIIDGLELAQVGGVLEWGPIGKIDAEGNETIWIADDVPPGSRLRDSSNRETTLWPLAPAGSVAVPVEGEFATAESRGIRIAVAIDAFRERWLQDFLAEDFADLAEAGIDGFITAVEARLKATNDAVDAGFVRARADIYRVRQFMLGADAASRLVTSPALADIATRDEGARATSADLSLFLKNVLQRDGGEPPGGAPPAGVPPAPSTAPAPSGGGVFISPVAFEAIRPLTPIAPAPRPSTPLVSLTAQPLFLNLTAPAAGTQMVQAAPAVLAVQAAPLFTAQSFAGVAAASREFAVSDIHSQLWLPGAVERTISVAERLKPSPAAEAQQAALAGKFAAINAIAGLLADPSAAVRPKGIALADLPAPGFQVKDGRTVPPPRLANTIGDVIQDRRKSPQERDYNDLDQVAAGTNHESAYFNAAVAAIDNTIGLMRLVEGRIDLYQRLVEDARSVRTALQRSIADADVRLRAIEVEVAEARHDVGVAAALLGEEQARVDTLNARRAAILAEHAKMLLFRRPRRALHVGIVPTAPATAALAEPPVAVCLREHEEVPEELREYAGLFRDVPVAWFPAVKARLDLLDRLDAARAALQSVRHRALIPPLVVRTALAATTPKVLSAVYGVIRSQRVITEQRRALAAQLDFTAIAAVDLSVAQRAVAEAASISDLIAGEHNRPALVRLAASEIEAIGQVAGCLHASFAEVPPIVRLGWAEIFSEFDQPAPLSQLAGLPDWGSLPLELRRSQQGFVDWLFSRIDRSIPQAEAAINGLIRVCLLMAAHAPVDRIIPARLVAPVPARIGIGLDLAVDVRLARVGMTALIRGADNQPIAHALIEDLADGIARARITRTFQQVATISTTVRVDLSHIKLS